MCVLGQCPPFSVDGCSVSGLRAAKSKNCENLKGEHWKLVWSMTLRFVLMFVTARISRGDVELRFNLKGIKRRTWKADSAEVLNLK